MNNYNNLNNNNNYLKKNSYELNSYKNSNNNYNPLKTNYQTKYRNNTINNNNNDNDNNKYNKNNNNNDINSQFSSLLNTNTLEPLLSFISNISFENLKQIKSFYLEKSISLLIDQNNDIDKSHFPNIIHFIKAILLGLKLQPNDPDSIKNFLEFFQEYPDEFYDVFSDSDRIDINFLISYLS